MTTIGYLGQDPQLEPLETGPEETETCKACGAEYTDKCHRCYPDKNDPCFDCGDDCEKCTKFK